MIDVCCKSNRYKDGIELRSGGKYRIVEDDDKVQLIVRGVDKDDAGDITCELSNSKGKEAATAKLRVQSMYRPVQMSSTLSNKTAFTVSRVFSWRITLLINVGRNCRNMSEECEHCCIYDKWFIFGISVVFVNCHNTKRLFLIVATFFYDFYLFS